MVNNSVAAVSLQMEATLHAVHEMESEEQAEAAVAAPATPAGTAKPKDEAAPRPG